MNETDFVSEKHLQEHLASIDLTEGLDYVDLKVKREQPVGSIIPDILYVGFLHKPSKDPWPRKWTFQHAYLIWHLRRRKRLHATTLARRLYQSLARVTRHLRELESSGAVERHSTGSYTLAADLADLSAEIVAVEVKLSDWRGALDQALRYANFADRVVVALDGNRIVAGDIQLRMFSRAGIGLCAAWHDRVEWIVGPRQQRPPDGRQREYLIAAADSDRHSWLAL